MNILIVNSGEFGLVGERDDDLQRKFSTIIPTERESFIGIVKSEFPFAIQIQPWTANELWPRILRPRHCGLFIRHTLIKKYLISFPAFRNSLFKILNRIGAANR